MSEKMTTSEPTTGEIVRKLETLLPPMTNYAESVCADGAFAHSTYLVWDDPEPYIIKNGIDRLKSQEREIAIMKEEINRREELHHSTYLLYKKDIADLANQLEKFKAFHERYAEQTSKKYVDDICALTARAEQAERERDAAKADMKLIVDAVRETHCDDTCCFACKHDCDMSINDSGECNNECPGFDRDDCFEWRGLPQEGEGKI